MSSRGRWTDKDDIIDMIEKDYLEGEPIDEAFVDRLLKISKADLYMLQIIISKAHRAGVKKGKGEDE
jgi:hypothetical protein